MVFPRSPWWPCTLGPVNPKSKGRGLSCISLFGLNINVMVNMKQVEAYQRIGNISGVWCCWHNCLNATEFSGQSGSLVYQSAYFHFLKFGNNSRRKMPTDPGYWVLRIISEAKMNTTSPTSLPVILLVHHHLNDNHHFPKSSTTYSMLKIWPPYGSICFLIWSPGV